MFTPRGLPRQMCRDLALLVETAVDDGATWGAIEHALVAWSQRTGITPGLLPNLIADAVKAEHGALEGRPAPARASTADAAVAAAEALRTTPDRPALRALAGGQP